MKINQRVLLNAFPFLVSMMFKLNSVEMAAFRKSSEGNVTDLVAWCPNRTILEDLCRKGPNDSDRPRCVMSINSGGRLGNRLSQYASLYALARWNRRPAFMHPIMTRELTPFFRVSLPPLDEQAASCIESNITYTYLYYRMLPGYQALMDDPEQSVMLAGYPDSWTYFDHIGDEIRREFLFHEPIVQRAQTTLRSVRNNRTTVTFIGVHVRRTDYALLMAAHYGGVMAGPDFFQQAMAHFRSRYADAVFVVASDDMDWCRTNMTDGTSEEDVYLVGNVSDPVHDLAMLAACNHSIITVGMFGFWSAYLAGGETVYFSNYLLPNSEHNKFFSFKDMYLPTWTPINASEADLAVRAKHFTPSDGPFSHILLVMPAHGEIENH